MLRIEAMNKIKKELLSKRLNKWKPEDLLSTGSTVLDCAISDYEFGGIKTGEIIMTVGASTSGKTAFYQSILAEACINPRFDDYEIYVDDSEGGNLFDVKKFWGKRLARRMRPPKKDNRGRPVYSSTIEEMGDTIDDLCREGKPFIFVEDSVDALMTRGEQQDTLRQKRARRLGSKEVGTYGTDKAKKMRTMLRNIRHKIRKCGAIVILVFQESMAFGMGAKFDPKTHAGGLAPKFYSNLQLWFSIRKSLTKKIGNITNDQGIIARIKIKKNRLTGKKNTVDLPFYNSYGFDNIGSCIDFLMEVGYWRKKANSIKAEGLGFVGKRSKLIDYIETCGLEPDLKGIVGEVWRQKEAEASLKRKPRYT